MSMYRSWLYPIFSSVPTTTRLSGALPMAFYAAVNPMSWFKPPYIGVVVYVTLWWMLWNLNVWGVVRFEGEDPDEYWWWWVVRTSFYSIFLTWIPLTLVYLFILGVIKISVNARIQ